MQKYQVLSLPHQIKIDVDTARSIFVVELVQA